MGGAGAAEAAEAGALAPSLARLAAGCCAGIRTGGVPFGHTTARGSLDAGNRMGGGGGAGAAPPAESHALIQSGAGWMRNLHKTPPEKNAARPNRSVRAFYRYGKPGKMQFDTRRMLAPCLQRWQRFVDAGHRPRRERGEGVDAGGMNSREIAAGRDSVRAGEAGGQPWRSTFGCP
jgi:hypothetical protein